MRYISNTFPHFARRMFCCKFTIYFLHKLPKVGILEVEANKRPTFHSTNTLSPTKTSLEPLKLTSDVIPCCCSPSSSNGVMRPLSIPQWAGTARQKQCFPLESGTSSSKPAVYGDKIALFGSIPDSGKHLCSKRTCPA